MNSATSNLVILTAEINGDKLTGTAIDGDIKVLFTKLSPSARPRPLGVRNLRRSPSLHDISQLEQPQASLDAWGCSFIYLSSSNLMRTIDNPAQLKLDLFTPQLVNAQSDNIPEVIYSHPQPVSSRSLKLADKCSDLQ